MTNDDPLAELLVDADSIDKQALADVLKKRVAIDSKSGRLVPAEEYPSLGSRRKVLAMVLARKAAHLLRVVDSHGLSNKEIVEVTGLPRGTAAPSLKDLREGRYVAQVLIRTTTCQTPRFHGPSNSSKIGTPRELIREGTRAIRGSTPGGRTNRRRHARRSPQRESVRDSVRTIVKRTVPTSRWGKKASETADPDANTFKCANHAEEVRTIGRANHLACQEVVNSAYG